MQGAVSSISDFFRKAKSVWLHKRKKRARLYDEETEDSMTYTTYISLESLVASNDRQTNDSHNSEAKENSRMINHYTDPRLLSKDYRTESRNDKLQESQNADILLKHCNDPALCRPTIVDRNRRYWSVTAYSRARKELLRSISYFYESSVIVWCPLLVVKCHFVESLLPQLGEVIHVHDRWISDDNFQAYHDSWGGVIAVYATESMAKAAAKEIPARHDFMKTLTLSKLLKCLIKSELLLPKGDEKTTEIAILCGEPDPDLRQSLELLLLKFGDVVSISFHDPKEDTKILCEVSYSYATHAFLAMTVLDGLPFGSSVLTVVVRKTEKELKILDRLLFELKKYNGRAYFPFKGLC